MITKADLDRIARERIAIAALKDDESLFYCPDHAGLHLTRTDSVLRCPVDYAAFAPDGLYLVRLNYAR